MFVLDEDKKEERGHGPLYLYLSGSVLENRDSRYLVGIGIYFGKPKKKETFIYNSS